MKRFVSRIGTLTALFFAIGIMSATPVGAAQTSDTARITIHNRICPEGFSGPDYYGACHDTAPNPGLPFSLSGPESSTDTTDSSGNVAFEGLIPGDYAISGGVPGEFADVNYFCAEADALTVVYPFTETMTGLTIALPAGADIICDWYNTPINMSGLPTATPVGEAASLTVYAAICPVGYMGSSYFDDCFENAADAGAVTYTLAEATGNPIDQPVGADGHARFMSLSGGTFSLSDSVPGDALDGRFVYCTIDGANPQTFALDYTENTINLSIAAGQDVVCDWYIVPANLKGEPAPTATATVVSVSTATPTVSGGGVVGLPNTGSGSAPAAIGGGFGVNGLLGLLAIGFLTRVGMFWQRYVQPAANASKIRTSGTDARREARR